MPVSTSPFSFGWIPDKEKQMHMKTPRDTDWNTLLKIVRTFTTLKYLTKQVVYTPENTNSIRIITDILRRAKDCEAGIRRL